jgi:hypothetical protein
MSQTALSKENLLRLSSEYQAQGWTTIPADDPRRGIMGFWACKGDKEESCEWPIFGQALTPEDRVCTSLEELLDVVDKEKSLGALLTKCDDPMRLLLGVVSYREAPVGKSTVYQVKLGVLKEGLSNAHLRERFDAEFLFRSVVGPQI